MELDQLILKFIVEQQKIQKSQNNLGKKEQSWRLTLFTFKVYHKATTVKTVWCCRVQK